jgi:4-hydroxybenzoate polyprenyltransferase
MGWRSATAWARLARIPNLFTVPGDPLAGYLAARSAAGADVVSSAALASTAASALLLYLGGLFLNDVFDREVDRRERPERPLPSGAVRSSTVLAAGIACLVAAVGIACLGGGVRPAVVAAVVAGLVLAYDGVAKRNRWLGPAVMAACRAGSVILGAAAFTTTTWASSYLVLVAAGATWLYTAVVTRIAATETSGEAPRGAWPYAPAIALAASATLGVAVLGVIPPIASLVFLVMTIGDAIHAGWQVASNAAPVPEYIGRLVRALVTLQGAWICWALADEPVLVIVVAAGVVVLARAAAGFSSKKFYGS